MSIKTSFPVVLIIMGLSLFGSGCGVKEREESSAARTVAQGFEDDAASGVAQKILSFNLEGYRKNGQKKWELGGACADILSNVIKLDYVTAKAYGDESSLTLTAKKGIYDKNTKDVHLMDNVVGKSSDGAKLMTDRLDWNQNAEEVTTDSLVRIEKDNLFSVGRGVVGNPGLKQVKMNKDVTIEIRDNNPPTVITCDGPLVVDYQKSVSVLKNNVKITDPRGAITADLMKVLFDTGSRKITRVIAIGNVKIQREGNATYSERAVYTVKDGRVRLMGKPRIVVFPKGAQQPG